MSERAGGAGRREVSFGRREAIWGFLFISPWLAHFLLLDLMPLLSVFYFSLTDYAVIGSYRWVGLSNYARAFGEDYLYWRSLGNTLYYMGLAVPVGICAAFAVAMLLNAKIRGQTLYRTLFYLPSVVPLVASSMVWIWLLHARYGIVNYLLSFLGLGPIRWLSDPAWAKPALIMMSLWVVGGSMIIYLAGLQGIPQELYEAAEIDGAGPVRRFLHVTIPMMTPTILFNLVMGIIWSFQVFSAAFIMTGGGPFNATLFYMLHLYNNAFIHLKMGYASAMAVVLFFIVLGLTIVVLRTSRNWVHYES